MENMIDIDYTIFIQLVNFLVTIVVLNFLLIKPVRDQISARNSLLLGYANEATSFAEKADAKLSQYEAALAEARALAGQARDALKAEGLAQEQHILSDSHAEAQAFLNASREQIAQESKAAMKTLLSQVDTFAAKAMGKILG